MLSYGQNWNDSVLKHLLGWSLEKRAEGYFFMLLIVLTLLHFAETNMWDNVVCVPVLLIATCRKKDGLWSTCNFLLLWLNNLLCILWCVQLRQRCVRSVSLYLQLAQEMALTVVADPAIMYTACCHAEPEHMPKLCTFLAVIKMKKGLWFFLKTKAGRGCVSWANLCRDCFQVDGRELFWAGAKYKGWKRVIIASTIKEVKISRAAFSNKSPFILQPFTSAT